MQIPLETSALGRAVLAGWLSLGVVWLSIKPIKTLTASSPVVQTEASPNNVASSSLVDEGRNFFAQSCSHCHGEDAHGDEGPDLHNLTISNARIATTIKKGIKGEMPSFAKKYNDQQIAALVGYLRSLR